MTVHHHVDLEPATVPLHDGHVHNGIYQSNHQALYRLLEELKSANPSLVLEAEWPVGHMSFSEDPWYPETIQAWESRYGQESLRWFTLAQYSLNYLYGPPDWNSICLGTEIEDDPICDSPEDLETDSFRKYWIRSRMLGGFALSGDIGSWEDPAAPGFAQLVSDHVDFFKDNRRFYGGKSHTLISQHVECTDLDEDAPCINSWDAVEFLDEEELEALVFAFRNASADEARALILQDLECSACYEVVRADAPPDPGHEGWDLMTNGYELSLPDEWTSDMIVFSKSGSCVPPGPTLQSIVELCPQSVGLTWDGPGQSGVSKYRIERALEHSGDFVTVGETNPSTEYYVDARVRPGKTYSYRVVAEFGECDSEQSNVQDVDTSPDPDGDGYGNHCDSCPLDASCWGCRPLSQGAPCRCYAQADCKDNDSCTLDLCLKEFGSDSPWGECKNTRTCP